MVYIYDVIAGLSIFPFIAALFTLPYVMVQYHKYGSVSKYRTLIIYSFILYMLIAYFMVILPLPDFESTVGNTIQDHLNLIPFRQIWLYWHDKVLSLETLKAYLKSMALWQLLFNILLTVPFGVYMHYYFRQSLKRTILFSFLLSLFYETSQLTALFGIYPGPYRLADVEDLICNTMGGAIGFQFAYLFNIMLPSRAEIDEYCRERGRIISGMRRFWAVLFDYVICAILLMFLNGALIVLIPGFKAYTNYVLTYHWTFFCIFSLVQVLLSRGYTLGHAICRMILVSKGGSAASAAQIVKRYFFLWLFTDFPLIIAELLNNGQSGTTIDIVIILLFAASRLYFVIYFIKEAVLKGERPMAHDKLSGTVYMAAEIPPETGQEDR